MSKEYEDMSLSELEKLKKSRLISELQAEDSKNEDIAESEPKLVQNLNMSKAGDTMFSGYYKQYIADTGYEESFIYDSSDSGCDTDISNWSPSENFIKAIWHTVYAESKLLGVASVNFNVAAGAGNVVDIRTIGKFSAPSELAACECGSCASNSLSKYSITLKQYALGTVICGFDLHDIGYDYYKKTVEAMGKRYAEFFDDQLWSELNTATAGYTKDLDNALSCTPSIAGSCCTDSSLVDLYNAVVDVVAYMQGQDYEPDYIIMHPSVSAILKRMQTPSVQPWASSIISIDSEGRLAKFNGLKVIEFSGASSCTNASGTHVAIVIDSRRALGAAFGKKPFLKKEESASCNSTELYMWSYFNCAELDTGAISHVQNP